MSQSVDPSAVLAQLKAAIVRSRNEAEQLQLVVKAASLAIGNGACSIWLAKQAGERPKEILELAASCGYDHDYQELATSGKPLPSYELRGRKRKGVTGWIFLERKSFHASVHEDFKNCQAHAGRFDRLFWNHGREAQSFYGTWIPGATGETPLGIIKVEHREPGHLDDTRYQALIEVVAATLGSLLDTSRLDALTTALTFFAHDVPANDAYDQVVELCRAMTNAEASSLFILDPELKRLVMRGDAGHDFHFVWEQDTDDPDDTYGPPEAGEKPGLTWEVLWTDDGVTVIESHDELLQHRDIWASRFWDLQWKEKNKKLHSLYMRRIGLKERPIGVIKVENKLGPGGETAGQRFSPTDQKMLDAFSRALEPLILLQEGAPKEIRVAEQYTDVFGDKVLRRILDSAPQIANTGLADYQSSQAFHESIRRMANRLSTRSAFPQPLKAVSEFLSEDLLPSIRIPGRVAELFSDLAEAENALLYRQRKYRDHAVHAFNVFMLGYAILVTLPAARVRAIQRRLTEQFGTKRQGVDVLQAWTLASLFHDVGQPVQQVHDWLAAYIEDVFRVPAELRADRQLIRSLVRLDLVHYSQYYAHLASTVRAVQTCLQTSQREQVHDAIMSALDSNFNHGIVSSVLLSDKIRASKSKVDRGTLGAALSAMALHDRRVWDLLKIDWINQHEAGQLKKLSFRNQPLAFLLMYCDNSQEWGRAYVDPRVLEPSMEGIPKVLHLDVDSNHIHCELSYDEPNSELREGIRTAYESLSSAWACLDDESGLEWVIRSRDATDTIASVEFLPLLPAASSSAGG